MKTKTKLSETDIMEIRNYIERKNIILLIHSIYLLNFCIAGPDSGRVKYMHDNINYDLQLGSQLGAKCVVLHLGFAKDIQRDIAISNLIDNINRILDKNKKNNIRLALETSAGQGSQIGYTLEELAIIWNGVKKNRNKVGICIDTAHIFVSGYDISNVIGLKNYMEKFNNLIGWENIINFHINDSRWGLGMRKDEHRGIGNGMIYKDTEGINALKYLIHFCKIRNIPMILETHGAASSSNNSSGGYKNDISLIHKLV